MRISIEVMEKNLLNCWEKVTPQNVYNGLYWYPIAHNFAINVGQGDVRKGAGIIAALSPNKAWATNRVLAMNASNGVFAGHVGNALGKAKAIYDGADPASVLPMARKTGHFYMNIFDPLDPRFVTIDRHAIRAVKSVWDEGEPKITLREYDDCVVAYQNVAKTVGIVPSAFQAGIWEWARTYYKAR